MKILSTLAYTALLCLIAGCDDSVSIGQTFDAEAASPEQRIRFVVKDGDTGQLKDFLDRSPDLATAFDSTGNTLLHHAAMAGQTGTARLLVERDADVNALNLDNFTPLAAAHDRNAAPAVIEYLESVGGTE